MAFEQPGPDVFVDFLLPPLTHAQILIKKLALDTKPATTHIFSKGKIPKKHARKSNALKRSKTKNMVQKTQPLRSCVGLSILATSYCAYSDPFPTGLLKCPYSFFLGQGNEANPPPHREKQRPKCTDPPPL